LEDVRSFKFEMGGELLNRNSLYMYVLGSLLYVSFNSNNTGVAEVTGTTNPSEAPEFIPIFVGFALLDL